jgi:tRNA dimethylallyltransferase
MHNTTDVDTVKRAVRAIEIALYEKNHPEAFSVFPPVQVLVFGLNPEREVRRQRISDRLKQRLDQGLIEEVRGLMNQGLSAESLLYYGLEYKYVTLYLINRLTYDQMVCQLETAIHQFAKRQMTWFRGMERRGIPIHWLNPDAAPEDQVQEVIKVFRQLTS